MAKEIGLKRYKIGVIDFLRTIKQKFWVYHDLFQNLKTDVWD